MRWGLLLLDSHVMTVCIGWVEFGTEGKCCPAKIFATASAWSAVASLMITVGTLS